MCVYKNNVIRRWIYWIIVMSLVIMIMVQKGNYSIPVTLI